VKDHNHSVLGVLCALCVLCVGIGCVDRPQLRFTDVTEAAGIRFRYTFGDTTYQNIVESSGSGVTAFDYDGDGDLDLYLLNGTYLEGISTADGRRFAGTPDQLYRNNGDGTFTEVAALAHLDDRHWSMAAAPLDYDGDGDQDLFLANYGPNAFFRNNGDGTFTEVARALGLRGPDTVSGFTRWSVGGSWWDYDGDGLADLFVCNFLAFNPAYVSPTAPQEMPFPTEYHGQASALCRQGRDGRFTDVTRAAGLYRPESLCMGATVFDADGDGRLDLFQANDHQENFLFLNNGDGTFTEAARQRGVAVNNQGLGTGHMHGTAGDVDGDGLVDLLVSDLTHGGLYRQVRPGVFSDVTSEAGVGAAFEGKGAWATALLDFDNDGDLDIFSANGVAEKLTDQLPLLLENDGTGHFHDVGKSLSPYFREARSGRGAAVWDYDNDGDLDLIVSHIDRRGTAALLRNDVGNRNHWLGLTLAGAHGPASAIGAVVTVEAGGRRQVRVNQWCTSYLSCHDPRLHFGLGKARRVDRLEIRWPSGAAEAYCDVDGDRYLKIQQGQENTCASIHPSQPSSRSR
jgi:hypothetical protein